MRFLLAIAVLAAALPVHASVTCYGGDVVPAPSLEDCPDRIHNVVITPGVDQFTVAFDPEGGLDVYVYAQLGHDVACPAHPTRSLAVS